MHVYGCDCRLATQDVHGVKSLGQVNWYPVMRCGSAQDR